MYEITNKADFFKEHYYYLTLHICFKTMKLFRLQLKTIKVKIEVIVLILLLNIFMNADYY